MRWPRKRFLFPLMVLALLWVSLHFHFYYHLSGLIRNDSYFDGKPTCYWSAEANAQKVEIPPWRKKINAWLHLENSEDILKPFVFRTRDPTSVPVLFEIATDSTNLPDTIEDACVALSSFVRNGSVNARYPELSQKIDAVLEARDKKLPRGR